MKRKSILPSVSLFVKISFILAIGIIVTATFTLEIALRNTQKLFVDNYTASSKVNLKHLKDELLDVHTNVCITYDEFGSNNALRKLFTADDINPSAELAKSVSEAIINVQELWQISNLKDLTYVAIGTNGQSISSDSWGLRVSKEALYEMEPYIKYAQNPNTLQYVLSPRNLAGSDGIRPALVAIRSLKTHMGSTPFGLLIINLSETYFENICSQYIYAQNNYIITDENGAVLSGNMPDEKSSFSQFSSILNLNNDTSSGFVNTITINNTQCSVLYEYVPYMNIYLFSIIDKDIILNEFNSTKTSIFLIVCIVTIIVLILIFIITSSVSKPLKKFTIEILNAAHSHHHKHLFVEGSRETRRLAQAYNYMVDEILLYNTRLIDTEKQRHAAELTALQMQINPHFLYNTLASIKFLAIKGDNASVGTVINALIAMLRNTIGKTDEMVTMASQIENLKNYTDIMRLRYEKSIDVIYVINDDCLTAILPKLLLQPIVENSFFHAFNGGSGYIKIFAATSQNGRLVCQITDNGKGFDVNNMPNHNSKDHHLGLHNIRQRLALIYGDDYSFNIYSREGKGTTVIIELPFTP